MLGFLKRKKKKKRRKVRKIPVNTDGDYLPEDMVNQVREVAKQVGQSTMREIEENPELMAALQKEMARSKEPGPEDVLLLYIYGRGAISPEKAIPIPEGDEVETQMLCNYSDGYIDHVGDLIYVSVLGVKRLLLIGAISKDGKVINFGK